MTLEEALYIDDALRDFALVETEAYTGRLSDPWGRGVVASLFHWCEGSLLSENAGTDGKCHIDGCDSRFLRDALVVAPGEPEATDATLRQALVDQLECARVHEPGFAVQRLETEIAFLDEAPDDQD